MKIDMTKCPRPRPIAGEPLGFGKYFTDHMLVMNYQPETGWEEPRIQPYGPLNIHPSALVFHYGQAVFEGLKAFRGDDGKVRLFRPKRYLERLNRSANRICIPKVDTELLLDGIRELVALEIDWIPNADDGSLYLRPFIIASDPMLGVHASKGYILAVIASPVGSYFSSGFNPVRILACTDYVRACPGGVGEAKVAGNYAASLLAAEEAKKEGYDQVLWLDGVERRFIEEVGAMNIFFQIGDEVCTPKLTGSILPGVTRLSTLELLKSWGVPVSERRISIEEVADAAEAEELHEIFGTGTAAVIAPVSEINWGERSIIPHDGKVGPITERLYKTITDIQYGRIQDLMGWTEIVDK
jgi:branched-chain amino acid aminotransferase